MDVVVVAAAAVEAAVVVEVAERVVVELLVRRVQVVRIYFVKDPVRTLFRRCCCDWLHKKQLRRNSSANELGYVICP